MRESQHIEWKRLWRDVHLKWICAFANADGGTLILGRDDVGAAVGVADAAKLLEDLPNKVRDLLGILVDVNLRTEDGHELIEVYVAPSPYPISYKGGYFYRSGSTKQELEGAALDQFLLRKQGRHWDGVPAPGFGFSDLDPQAMSRFRQAAAQSGRLSKALLAEPDATLISKLRLTAGDYLKRAALLLFGRDPERLITGAYVKIGFFRTDTDLLYHDEIHGDLFTQVEQTVDLLLTKYLRAGLSYEGLRRIERFPIPERALREAVINAVAHKDYATAIPIQISVYADRLMLWNPGQLPHGWTLARLSDKHASHPFNPDIANAFFRTAYLDTQSPGGAVKAEYERRQISSRQVEGGETTTANRPHQRRPLAGHHIGSITISINKDQPGVSTRTRRTRTAPTLTGPHSPPVLEARPRRARSTLAPWRDAHVKYTHHHLHPNRRSARARDLVPTADHPPLHRARRCPG